MSFQSPFHQPPFNYSTFPSQQQLFVGPSNPFATSTMTPQSAYNPMSSMQYYRPTMPSQVSANQSDDNEIEGTDDDIPPPPPFYPSIRTTTTRTTTKTTKKTTMWHNFS